EPFGRNRSATGRAAERRPRAELGVDGRTAGRAAGLHAGEAAHTQGAARGALPAQCRYRGLGSHLEVPEYRSGAAAADAGCAGAVVLAPESGKGGLAFLGKVPRADVAIYIHRASVRWVAGRWIR